MFIIVICNMTSDVALSFCNHLEVVPLISMLPNRAWKNNIGWFLFAKWLLAFIIDNRCENHDLVWGSTIKHKINQNSLCNRPPENLRNLSFYVIPWIVWKKETSGQTTYWAVEHNETNMQTISRITCCTWGKKNWPMGFANNMTSVHSVQKWRTSKITHSLLCVVFCWQCAVGEKLHKILQTQTVRERIAQRSGNVHYTSWSLTVVIELQNFTLSSTRTNESFES